MKQEELVKGLKVLGIAYSKEFTQDECAAYYEFLQEYPYDAFRTAVKSIIKKSKYLPKISELIEECEKYKEQTKFDVLEFMNSKGYFKAPEEYVKASSWLEKNNIPEWFRNDLNEYYKMMKQEKIEYKETILIGGNYE